MSTLSDLFDLSFHFISYLFMSLIFLLLLPYTFYFLDLVDNKPAEELGPGQKELLHRLQADFRCLLQRRRRGSPVHLDVVVTSSIHNHAHEWHVASEGVAVAREERRKLREWGHDEILGCTARFESQGRWGQSAINELERLARLKGGLLAGSPHEAAKVAAASLARWRRWLSVVLQRGNAATVLAALGKQQPEPIDADLLQGGSELHLEAGPS